MPNAQQMQAAGLPILEAIARLTPEEVAFLRRVHERPGGKLNGDGEASDSVEIAPDQWQSRAFWEAPERLGLVECVGSYKWRLKFDPIELLALLASERLGGEVPT
jgi:hypothetical protein